MHCSESRFWIIQAGRIRKCFSGARSQFSLEKTVMALHYKKCGQIRHSYSTSSEKQFYPVNCLNSPNCSALIWTGSRAGSELDLKFGSGSKINYSRSTTLQSWSFWCLIYLVWALRNNTEKRLCRYENGKANNLMKIDHLLMMHIYWYLWASLPDP
jgi:hypothetical protein